jgi:4-hydroxybenzoate polyprenyltransferase
LLGLVRFSHSVFALPFALAGAWLAARGVPDARVLLLVLVACVAARTAAMAFNRLVDERIDARNPRTATRELPSGKLSRPTVLGLVLASILVFVASAFALNPLAGWLSLPVLFVLLGYSFTKRFTWACHLVLGLALALAPLGAWLAVRGRIDADAWQAVVLALAVLTWVAGFDLIYACQDREFDSSEGLQSIPARFGVRAALNASAALHAVTIAALFAVGQLAGTGWVYFATCGACAALLWWEHRIVRPDDLSRVDTAFFTLNGWMGIALFVGLALDLALAGGTGG